MATAKDMGIADVAFVADVDLTLAQYYFVTVASTAGNVKVATGASNPGMIGVLQNSPSLGQEARVRMAGLSKVFALTTSSSSITYGRFISVNASGQAVAAGDLSTCVIAGRWLDAATGVSASRFGQVFLNLFPATGSLLATS